MVRAHQHSAGAPIESGKQFIGRSKGGRSTKIHAKVDSLGLPLNIILSEGQLHDSTYANELIDSSCDYLLADKGYDSNDIRRHIAGLGAQPVIPGKSNRIEPIEYDKVIYKERNAVERFFAKIKHFRRVATRYDKLAQTYMGMVLLSAVIVWLRV